MKETIVIAGLGRCGSSLVMQMLSASGLPTTGEYPDFEDERVALSRTSDFNAAEWQGKAVKLLDLHRYNLNLENSRIVWLSRNERVQAQSISKFGHLMGGLPEYGRSQRRALERALIQDGVKCRRIIEASGQPFMAIRFEDLITRPAEAAERLAEFVGGDAIKMAAVIRKRGTECYQGMLELELCG